MAKFHLYADAHPSLFLYDKRKEVDHMMNWSYDLIKIMYEEKLTELLLNETAQKNQLETPFY
ncbi:hypothetical protein CEY02_06325 [Bacillus pumilus]|uniref:Uncharacterized protein n=1 Tax=Bacillus pumilus TaxID=1408 RepID=A0A2A5IYK0_BACPU|nr:hypothetical protein CEY02_06325 [Bacillus pumilus]